MNILVITTIVKRYIEMRLSSAFCVDWSQGSRVVVIGERIGRVLVASGESHAAQEIREGGRWCCRKKRAGGWTSGHSRWSALWC